jgi:hypothetical protein
MEITMRRHHFVVIAIAIAAGLLFWLWPRTARQHDTPAASSVTPAAHQPTVEEPAGERRPPPAQAEARRKHAELQKRILAAQEERRASRAANEAPAAFGAVPAAVGTLDKEYIKGRIAELKPLLAECYELARREQKDLRGKLVMSFDIVGEPAMGGLVDRAEIVRKGESDEIAHPVLDECVRATVESVTFAAPEGGSKVSVTYPFLFESGSPEKSLPDKK